MKRLQAALACCLICVWMVAVEAAAQSYDIVKSTGDHDFMFYFRQQARQALSPPADNVLSEWQKLPFAWKFFGQEVTGYYISDNGYITFDPQAKTSVAQPTALPSPTAPRNAIFAFWTDLRLEAGQGMWTNSVWTATFGEAPNRVHLIYYIGVVPAADTFATASIGFMLALYENGEFEAIFTSGRKASPLEATVGALSADGSMAVMAEGPAFDYPNVGYGGDDDLSYRFRPVVKKQP